MKHAFKLSLLLALTTAACGDAAPDSETPATSETPEPTEGSVVEGGTVTVRLSVDGFPIVEAGDMTSGTGHHHLYLDADLTAADEPVPTVAGSIVHMGDASSVYTFEGVAPGEHRLIAVVADGVHVPLLPWVVDTITFTVR
jgi:hypothetical protein